MQISFILFYAYCVILKNTWSNLNTESVFHCEGREIPIYIFGFPSSPYLLK